MNLLYRKNYIHFFFIFLLALYYLVPLFFIGQVAIDPHDHLDNSVVFNHIISKIYKGDFDSINYFLAGEIKWYYVEQIFYPINILHYVLNDKLFYFTIDILKKLFPYFSFYLLAKSFGASKFNSALGAVLYSSLVYIKMPVGLGLAFLPYILYLLLNKEKLNKKHYFSLFFIGLNSSLIQDIFSFILLIPLAFLLNYKTKNLRIYLHAFFVIFIASIISNIHLVIGSVLSDPIHREAWGLSKGVVSPLIEVLQSFFLKSHLGDSLFIFYLPLTFLSILLLSLPLFLKEKKINYLIYFIIFILILKIFLHHNYIDNVLVGPLNIFQGFNFQRVDRIIPLTYAILFIFYISFLKKKNLINFLYFISLTAVINVQLKTPLPIIAQYFFNENMYEEKILKVEKNFSNKRYIEVLKIILNNKNYNKNKISNNSINKTFNDYYRFADYAFIKKLVKNSRVMSVGWDPMIAVMNDIKVIDGYHNIYPLSYKLKFRKIIEKELEKSAILKDYYDNWGSRVYAFYTDKDNIELDFQFAKKLKADYVISKIPLNSNDLKIVCSKCNNSNDIFLYEIL